MAALLKHAKQLMGGIPETRSPAEPDDQRARNSKKALRDWRVILDKVGILLALAALQTTTEQWCLELGSPQRSLVELNSMEDYYAEVIKTAFLVPPLKSKEIPMVAISACVHPKTRLRGDGNGRKSYVVCRLSCEMGARDSGIGDSKDVQGKGPLSKASPKKASVPTTSALRTQGWMPTDYEIPEETMEEMAIWEKRVPWNKSECRWPAISKSRAAP